MDEVVDPLHGIIVSNCISYGPLLIFHGLTASLISQSSIRFTLPAVLGGTRIALLSNSQFTMDNAFEPGIRATFFRVIPLSIIITKSKLRVNYTF